MTRVPRPSVDELTLGHRLQWHASQCLRRGTRCSLLVLQPLGPSDLDRATSAPDDSAPSACTTSRLAAVAARVRTLVRHTDVVEVDESAGIGIFLHDADAQGARAVNLRVCRALADSAPARAASGADDAVLRLGVGIATAEPSEGVRLAALARQLVCVACAPDFWLSVPLPRTEAHPTRRRHRRAVPPRFGTGPSARWTVTRMIPRPHPSAWTPASASEECEELRRRADALGVPYVCLPARLPAALLRVLTPELTHELSAVPIGRTRGILTVAMLAPTNLSAIQRLAAATGLTIFPVLASERDLTRLLDQCAGGARLRQAVRAPAHL